MRRKIVSGFFLPLAAGADIISAMLGLLSNKPVETKQSLLACRGIADCTPRQRKCHDKIEHHTYLGIVEVGFK
jgi:hypothetical protein